MKIFNILLLLLPLNAALAQRLTEEESSPKRNTDTIVYPKPVVYPEAKAEAADGSESVVYPGEKPLPSEGDFVPGETVPEESTFEKTVNQADQIVVGKDEEIVFSKGGNTTEDHRQNSRHSLMVGYQLFSTWLPGKKAVNYTYIHSSKWSWDAEYAFQNYDSPIVGVDLGETDEKRYSLMGRRYVGNSFHFIMGPVYQDFSARVSGKVAGSGVSVASFGAENLGATLGLGNRWQWRNGITVGIDWLRVNVPLFTTKTENEILKDLNNKSDSEDVKKVIRTFNRIPTFVVFGLNVGYTF